jgi:hypothetical protein
MVGAQAGSSSQTWSSSGAIELWVIRQTAPESRNRLARPEAISSGLSGTSTAPIDGTAQ